MTYLLRKNNNKYEEVFYSGCIGLTGTPIQNDYDELWSTLNAVSPGCLNLKHHFDDTYSKPIKIGNSSKATLEEVKLKESRLTQLKSVLREVLFSLLVSRICSLF